MADFSLKQGDLEPPYTATLTDASGTSWAIGAAAVTFTMRHLASQAIVVNAQSCTVLDPSSNRVRYVWQAGDTDRPGLHVGEFHVVGETFPDTFYVVIDVQAPASTVDLPLTCCSVDELALLIPDMATEEILFAARFAIPRVEADAESLLLHALLLAERTETAIPVYPNQIEVPLRYTPVRSISAVSLDGIVYPNDAWTMTRTSIIFGITTFGLGSPIPSAASVTYVGGIGMPDLTTIKPPLLSRMQRIVMKYRDRVLGTAAVSEEAYAVQYLSEGFTDDELETIMPFRRIVTGLLPSPQLGSMAPESWGMFPPPSVAQ